MIIALLSCGYATGVFSSRKIERNTYDSVVFRYVTGNCHPDHDTVAAFRRRFLPHLKNIFVQILQIAHEMKLLKLGAVSLDGTKNKANASKHKVLSHGHASKPEKQLQQEINMLLEKAEQSDHADVPDGILGHELGILSAFLADNGYYGIANCSLLEQSGITTYIAVGREQHNPTLEGRFSDPSPLQDNPDVSSIMRHRLRTKLGRALYTSRKSTVEPVFGIIKHVMGFRQFSLRGFKKVKGEWDLIAIAWNLKRMHVLA